MEIPKPVQKLNERIGDCLGRNPHGDPLYRWIHSEGYFHWMRDISGYEERLVKVKGGAWVKFKGKRYKGFISMEPVYRERKMMPHFEDVWLIQHWHEAESEASWRIKYGSDALWPRMGYWTPVNAWAERGQLPTESLTDKIIEIVRKRRAMTAQEIYREGERELEAIDRHVDNTRAAIIDDACTAFGAIPGSRSGGVSIPMPGVDYSAPFQKSGEI